MPALREFVRVIAQREVHPDPRGSPLIFEPIPARLEQTLEFQFGHQFRVHFPSGHTLTAAKQTIVGAFPEGNAQIELQSGVISFAIFFRPTGLSRLLGIPVHEFSSRNFDAALVSSLTVSLGDRLAQCPNFQERVRTIEGVLLGMALQTPRKDTIAIVAEEIFSRCGVIRSIPQLASDTGLGVRQFERRFLSEIGMAPKLYARVARFQSALDAKILSPHRTWIEIAHSLQYHDQMHMIRDFQLLGGNSPKQLLSEIGDARPGAFAPGTSER
jgi:AraC-like DNA-binding protein